jgi:hypothetical protein
MNNGIAIPAGKRRSPVRDPKHRNYLPTFPSARRNTGGAHEHDSGDKIWLACHQIDGNPTSKSVTDGHYGIDPETPAELVCDPRISRKREAARHYSRSTEAEQVDSHHPVGLGRRADVGQPGPPRPAQSMDQEEHRSWPFADIHEEDSLAATEADGPLLLGQFVDTLRGDVGIRSDVSEFHGPTVDVRQADDQVRQTRIRMVG